MTIEAARGPSECEGSVRAAAAPGPATLLAILPEIERSFDVWSFEHRGLRYWPLLRSTLRTALMQPASARIVSDVPSEAGPAAAESRPKMTAEEISTLWKARFATLPPRVDALFLSRSEDNHDVVDGLAHDRMIDPIYRLAEKKARRTLKLRVTRGATAPNEHLAVAAQAVGPDEHADLDLKMPALPEVDRVLEWVTARGISPAPNSTSFRSLIKRTLHREIVFGALLDACRPKMVFLGVFDDPMQMAAVLACRRRGILVIDIQHGKQGRDHNLCTPWEKAPARGSELLPDRFWVWGEPTARQVSAGLGMLAKRHRPVVGGNVWLAEWKQGMHGGDGAARALAERSADAARRLVVCLQPIADPVPPALREAMEKSPADWVWWVRLHRKQRAQRQQISRLIAATGARFELDEPTALPLYPLIMASDCHLTGWSTVAFEAEAYGVPTVLFHPTAASIFESEIEEGRFLFAQDGDGVLSAVVAAADGGKGHGLAPYIVADLGAAGRLLGRLQRTALPRRLAKGLSLPFRRRRTIETG